MDCLIERFDDLIDSSMRRIYSSYISELIMFCFLSGLGVKVLCGDCR
jgi:hypothetical protein